MLQLRSYLWTSVFTMFSETMNSSYPRGDFFFSKVVMMVLWLLSLLHENKDSKKWISSCLYIFFCKVSACIFFYSLFFFTLIWYRISHKTSFLVYQVCFILILLMKLLFYHWKCHVSFLTWKTVTSNGKESSNLAFTQSLMSLMRLPVK